MERPRLSDGGTVVLPATAGAVALVALSDVRFPDNYVGMDIDHVRRLVAVLGADAHAEPVTLTPAPGGTWWLVSGRHRVVAALVAGRSHVLALLVPRLELRPDAD